MTHCAEDTPTLNASGLQGFALTGLGEASKRSLGCCLQVPTSLSMQNYGLQSWSKFACFGSSVWKWLVWPFPLETACHIFLILTKYSFFPSYGVAAAFSKRIIILQNTASRYMTLKCKKNSPISPFWRFSLKFFALGSMGNIFADCHRVIILCLWRLYITMSHSCHFHDIQPIWLGRVSPARFSMGITIECSMYPI